MISLLLILIPLVGAATAVAWPSERTRPLLLPITGTLSVIAALWLMLAHPGVGDNAWLGLDPLARAVLPVIAVLFGVCSFHGLHYLRIRSERPNRVFVSTLLALYALINAGIQARHLGLMWIAVEGATLAAVPLIHFNGTARAFEATWKYLLVGGTGVALSLLGSFCLGYASLLGGGSGDLTFATLMAQASGFSRPWLLTGWVLILVGYGTKMGLAPMHTWKPDAYGEAPGIVGALLAGGVTTVAFVAVLRVRAVVALAGAGAVADRTLLYTGLFSLIVAALFLLGTRDHKRMLAYSSVEHMGILSLGAALGPVGVGAALFHTWTNSLTKGALFLTSGTLRLGCGSSSLDEVRGTHALMPRTSTLFVTGLFAITACPPFGVFFSELRILAAGFATGHPVAMGILLACLLLAFLGLSRVIFGIVHGRPRNGARARRKPLREGFALLAPPIVLLALSLALGIHTPESIQQLWSAAVAQLFPAP